MVFSIFKKGSKDGKDRPGDKSGRATTVKPIGRPLDGPVNRSGRISTQTRIPAEPVLPEKDQARVMAAETAAKIDAIESEMARDFLRPTGGSTVPGPSTAAPSSALQRPTEPAPAAPAAGPATEPAAPHTQPPLEFRNTDFLVGDALAIEVGASDGHAVLDETAILFANAQAGPAEAMLRGAIEAGQLGAAERDGWRLLLELIQQRGDRGDHEVAAADYAQRFAELAPAWFDYPAERPAAAPAKPASAAASADPSCVRLPAVLGAEIIGPLEKLKALSQQFPALTLDLSDVKSIDAVAAELLLRVINAFKRASHGLTLVGPEKLIAALRGAIEPGRRDPSDAAWMLLIETYRLLREQHEFEEAAIQYCISFEVSPPSWEPPPANFRTRPAEPGAEPEPEPAAAPEPHQGLAWRGVIERDGEPAFGELLAAAKTQKQISVDCSRLRRVDFSAGSSLVGVLMRVAQAGAQVELSALNPLVFQLFKLLGVDAVAVLVLRPA